MKHFPLGGAGLGCARVGLPREHGEAVGESRGVLALLGISDPLGARVPLGDDFLQPLSILMAVGSHGRKCL